MARVTVSDYECQHDLLPAVCAKCGAPAADRVPRAVYLLEGQPGWVIGSAILFGLFCCPPLFILIMLRRARMMRVRLPMCPAHRDDWAWRDRVVTWVVIPVWCAGVVGVETYGLVVNLLGGDGSVYFCAGFASLFLLIFADFLVINRGAVRAERQEKGGVQLGSVHEEFVRALIEDRARDRVANPDRRNLRGDVRDDFDDEPV